MTSTLADYIATLGDDARTITKVTTQAKHRNRVSVYIDGEFAFGVSDEVAVRHGLRAGRTVQVQYLRDVERDENVASGKRLALRYISYRMRSEGEVRRRLRKENVPSETITEVVEQLRRIGVINDLAFAKAFGRDAALGRKWGPHRIARGLRQAGVSEADISEALDDVRHTLEDEDVLMSIAKKRWGQLARIGDPQKRKKRLYDYLARRGFDFTDIRRVLDEIGA